MAGLGPVPLFAPAVEPVGETSKLGAHGQKMHRCAQPTHFSAVRARPPALRPISLSRAGDCRVDAAPSCTLCGASRVATSPNPLPGHIWVYPKRSGQIYPSHASPSLAGPQCVSVLVATTRPCDLCIWVCWGASLAAFQVCDLAGVCLYDLLDAVQRGALPLSADVASGVQFCVVAFHTPGRRPCPSGVQNVALKSCVTSELGVDARRGIVDHIIIDL